MRNKFWMVLLAGMLVLSSFLTGCTAKKSTTLKVWIQWGDNPAQLQELFNQFGQANGVTVEVTAPLETDKILTGLTGSTPPDVLILSGGDDVKSYAKEGLIEPLNNWITQENINIADMFPAPLLPCQQGDTTWCLPWGNDIYALFWNKDLFKAAGLDPEVPPKTMDELVSMSEKLTKLDADGNIIQAGFIPDFSWSHIDLYAREFGGFWFGDDGQTLTLNSQPMIDALNWEAQFYQKVGAQKLLDFIATFGDYASSEQGFYASKTAFQVDGEWQPGKNCIQALAPNLNYGVAPFPYPANHPERANLGVVQGTVVVIPAKSTNKEMAAKIISWMESPQILADEMFTNSNLPTSKTAAADPRFKDIPNFLVFQDLMASPTTTFIVTTPITLDVVTELGTIEQEVLYQGADAKTLLDAAQTKYEPILADALK